jgi:hypothetical protein
MAARPLKVNVKGGSGGKRGRVEASSVKIVKGFLKIFLPAGAGQRFGGAR